MFFQNKQFLFYFAFVLANFSLLSFLLLRNKQTTEVGKLGLMYIIGLVIVYYIVKWLLSNNHESFTWFLVVALPLLSSYYYITNIACDLCSGKQLKLKLY